MENKNSGYEKLAEKIADQIKKIKGVQAVILFGSYARGEQKLISDIDICVIADKKIPEKTKAEIASFSSKKLDVSIFWDLPPSVRFRAIKEGKVLSSVGREFLHEAEVRTVLEYLDFKHILDRNIYRVLGHEQ